MKIDKVGPYILWAVIMLASNSFAFSIDGHAARIGSVDLEKINNEVCLGIGIERYVGWEFPSPNSYIIARVSCSETLAGDGKLRRNIYDVINKTGRWEANELIATETKYSFPQPVKFIYISSNTLTEEHAKEVMDILLANYRNNKELSGASCNVSSFKDGSGYDFFCNQEVNYSLFQDCSKNSCVWTIIKTYPIS